MATVQPKKKSWQILDWDSAMTGKKTGRIKEEALPPGSIKVRLGKLRKIMAACRKERVQYLLLRLNIADWGLIQTLVQKDFFLLDVMVAWGLVLSKFPVTVPAEVMVREAVAEDLPKLMEVAGNSFKFDRYHNDPAIGRKKADRMHADWIRNLYGGLADKVLVAVEQGNILGFISIKFSDGKQGKTGTIILIAVAAGQRGRGVGRGLVLGALNYMKNKNAIKAEVGTQITNQAAWSLYQKIGFELEGATATLRYLYKGK